jgi:uncharacterized protein YjbJ (UPF0337 family)
MGLMNKLRNRFQMGSGRAKAKSGRASGRPYLETKGQGQRISGAARQVTEPAKDAGRNVRRAFRK